MCDNVFSLQAARETREVEEEGQEDGYSPHASGPAKCLACDHEWVAVVPHEGTRHDLVCPKCDMRRGQFMYPFETDTGCVLFQCNCGSQYFTLVVLDKDGRFLKGENGVLRAETGRGDYRLMCTGCGQSIRF